MFIFRYTGEEEPSAGLVWREVKSADAVGARAELVTVGGLQATALVLSLGAADGSFTEDSTGLFEVGPFYWSVGIHNRRGFVMVSDCANSLKEGQHAAAAALMEATSAAVLHLVDPVEAVGLPAARVAPPPRLEEQRGREGNGQGGSHDEQH